jgi:hypothetical protein
MSDKKKLSKSLRHPVCILRKKQPKSAKKNAKIDIKCFNELKTAQKELLEQFLSISAPSQKFPKMP